MLSNGAALLPMVTKIEYINAQIENCVQLAIIA
jgi:hypothetical protein